MQKADTNALLQDVSESFAAGYFDEMPHASMLLVRELDFSPGSLNSIDAYLSTIHRGLARTFSKGRKIENLPPATLFVITLRTGAYAGEVIRRGSDLDYTWKTIDELLDTGIVRNEPPYDNRSDLKTKYVLVAREGAVWFPMNKVVKFLRYGPGDSVHAFARIAIEGLPRP